MLQVEVFWVVKPCSVVVRYHCFGGILLQHCTASQTGRSRLEISNEVESCRRRDITVLGSSP